MIAPQVIENNFVDQTLEDQVRAYLIGKTLRLTETYGIGGCSISLRHSYGKPITSATINDRGTLRVGVGDMHYVDLVYVTKLHKWTGNDGQTPYLEVTTSDGTRTNLCM